MFFLQKEKDTSEFLLEKMRKLKVRSFIFSYTENLILSVMLEDLYDSDNGEEYGSKEYDEYNEWVVHIKKVIKDKDGIVSGKEFLVLNYKNFPEKITTLDGKLIYKKT